MRWSVKKRLREIDKTETTRFLLPMIGDKNHRDNFFINEYFVNAYIGDANRPEYDNHIILRYKYAPSRAFLTLDRQIIVLKGIVAEYDYDTDMSVMYVFKIPEELLSDYQAFLEGRYSDFTTLYKLRILKFWSLEYVDSLIESILFKTDKIKSWWEVMRLSYNDVCIKGELWYKPQPSREIYHHKQ